MNKLLGFLCLVASLWSGSGLAAEETPPSSPIYPGNRLDAQRGRMVYQRYCAACHDEGKDGAPRLRDADAWKARSFDAFSVMNEHAQNGFLRMPAKGRHPTLGQPQVADAVFFMTQTIQERAGKPGH